MEFDESAKFLLFIGTPRSGHSVFGAILDAHPMAVVSHEVNALERIWEGVSGSELLGMILENSAAQAAAGRSQSDADHTTAYGQRSEYLPSPQPYRFDYEVPGQYQGKVAGPLKVIGDKKGGGTTKILAERPYLLEGLREEVGLPLHLIHVVRDPYDNIATMARRTGASTRSQVDRYSWLYENVHSILDGTDSPLLQVHYEDFVASPREGLGAICNWLGLDCEPDYVEACASIVYDKPNRSRFLVEWDGVAERAVEGIIERWPVLSRYG